MNPLLQPVDFSTGQIITTSDPANQFTAPYSVPAGSTQGGESFLGSDGFLSKAAETAADLFGLYSQHEVQRNQIEQSGSEKNPVILESQRRAGILPSVESFPAKELLVGGAIAVGASVLIIGAIFALKD
jgi:hypothetical protein